MIYIWFLIIMGTSGSGFVRVPEPSEQACKAEAALVVAASPDALVYGWRTAFCVKGSRE